MKAYNDIMSAINDMSNSESKAVRIFSNVLSVVIVLVILSSLSAAAYVTQAIADLLK